MGVFTKKELRKIFEEAEIEVPKDVMSQIFDLHTTSNEDLTDKVKELEKDLEKAEQERDEFKAKAPKDGEETVLKKDYDTLKEEYDNYKSNVQAKETYSSKEKAYREMLKEEKVSEKWIDRIIKFSKDEINAIELDKEGKTKDKSKYSEKIKTEWGDYIADVEEKGINTSKPPKNNGGKMTKEEIIAIKDRTERQNKIAENIELFQ